jgi:hypothetical protein
METLPSCGRSPNMLLLLLLLLQQAHLCAALGPSNALHYT